jgi:hypothetical protein
MHFAENPDTTIYKRCSRCGCHKDEQLFSFKPRRNNERHKTCHKCLTDTRKRVVREPDPMVNFNRQQQINRGYNHNPDPWGRNLYPRF